MTRLLVTWVGFTILQLGIPPATGAAELRPGDESTRAAPRLEALSSAVLAREGSRADGLQGTHAPPIAAVDPARPRFGPPGAEAAPRQPVQRGPAFLSFFLPDARAPPA